VSNLLFHCVKVGRFFSIDVRIHWSFWVLPIGIGLATLSQGLGAAAAMMLFVLVFYAQGVVLHEYGHALAARALGVRTRDIILTPIGGIARMESMPENPVHEIIIALAGPAVNVVCGIGLFVFLISSGIPAPKVSDASPHLVASDYLWLLVGANGFMVGFNMLPAFPSDGGRVFRALLSLFFTRLTATQVAVYTGAVVALGMAIYGVKHGAIQVPFIALLFAFIGQMELTMVRRQAQMRKRPRIQSADLSPERSVLFQAPEPNFSGYAWDPDSAAWIEWRDGVAVRKCRMRVG
jgi:Zn-dependent protease